MELKQFIPESTSETHRRAFNSRLFKRDADKRAVPISLFLQDSLFPRMLLLRRYKVLHFTFLFLGFLLISLDATSNTSQASRKKITGKVSNQNGEPISGASVIIAGPTTVGTSDSKGNFEVSVPESTIELIITSVGYEDAKVPITNQNDVSVILVFKSNVLSDVVVTGYTAQRKKDIIGAVSVVSANDLKETPSANLVAQLQGRAAGVTVSTTGDPGTTAGIRIRGFASYGNNNPLYIIDGVATTNVTNINSGDIESIQVLKDATSASIYGARAANGVIIITTKRGKANISSVSYDSYVGYQRLPYDNIPRMLNTNELMQYLTLTKDDSYTDPVFGRYGSFSVPDYYIVSSSFKGGVSASDPRANPDLYSVADYSNIYQIFVPSLGTNWFKEMSRNSLMHSHQISGSGGNEKSVYSFGLNYFNQEGIFKYTGYNRYTARINSTFKPTHYLSFGENLQVGFDNRTGDNTVIGEESGWANSYRSSTFVPVRDIEGGWGGSLIGGTAGNGKNPVAHLFRRKDWLNKSLRAIGNVFADINLTGYLTARTSFGIDASTGSHKRPFLKEYEQPEARSITSYEAGSSNNFNWIWTNTLNFQKKFSGAHDVKVLVGTEALKNTSSSIQASKSRYDFESLSFLSLATGLPQSLSDVTANDNNNVTTINSYFGRLDYTFRGKYLLNATFRRDGSSVFGPNVRYGNFPAVGLGWRVSDESFMQNVSWISDFKVRGGWGRMGSISNVPAINQYSTYSSNPGDNNYDLAMQNTSSTQGFGVSRQGNLDTKWETTETTNIGLDVSALNGRWNLTVDLYNKNTSDLLVPSLRNGLEIFVSKPQVNLGTMNNKGIDIVLSNSGSIVNSLNYNASITFSHYKNKLTKLNDEDTKILLTAGRLANVLLTTKGYPVSSFYGYQTDGFYNNPDEVEKGVKINGQPGQVGSWKFQDINGDGNITSDDATVIGTPHPDFQMGFNLDLSYKGFDFSSLIFWNYGNEIFHYNKYFTYMGILGGSVAAGKLYDAWTPDNPSAAKSPRLGVGTQNGYTSFVTSNPSSFYIESGSYLRFRTFQLGYTIPKRLTDVLKISNLRVYAQAQNLWTISKYSGADPDLGLISGNGTDQNIGVDYSGFPNPKQFLFGVNLSF